MAIPAQLMQQFLRVDKRYSINPSEEPFFDMPTSLYLEKIEYIPPTTDEIRQQAESKLLVSLNKNKDAVNERYQKTVDNLEVKRQAAYNKAELAKQTSQTKLQSKIDEISYDMLRRGLSHSSICQELIQKAKDDASSNDISVDWQLELALKEIDVAEQNAVEQRDTALANLQKNYEAELEQEIAEIEEAVEKKIESTTKYNNTQTEKEADYKKDWYSSYIDAKQSHAESARTLLTVSINDGYETIQQYIFQDKATFTKDFYLAYDARTAYNEIVSLRSEYVAQLSQTYYDQVLSFFSNRL